MRRQLDNIFWHALSGDQHRFALGSNQARRFAPGFPAILAFPDPERPRLDALNAVCARGEAFYVDGWSGPPPAGWQIDAERTMDKMIWTASKALPVAEPDAVRLSAEHLPQMLALIDLTRPGPFGPRSLELGDYFGLFERGALVAMAGERAHHGPLREISAVATHPDCQGRGLARELMSHLMHRQLQRGETPFLHVMSDNAAARSAYLRLGFEDHRTSVVRVISRQ